MSVAFVQATSRWDDSGDAAATIDSAFGSNATAGNTIWSGCTIRDTDQTPSPQDLLGNTYTLIAKSWNAGETMGAAHAYATSILGGANTAEWDYSPSNVSSKIYAAEYSGVDTSSPLDGHNEFAGNVASTSTDAVTSGSFSTANNNSMVGGMLFTVSGPTITEGTGFTMRENDGNRIFGEDMILATAGSTAATFTTSVGGLMAVLGAAFKEQVEVVAQNDDPYVGFIVNVGRLMNR